ncbi:MAG: exodeoxyribonuclease V subunit beta [Desulfobacter sp.]|nr:MAG: exodeoxyribonuclease V subunit beta [Desulfobacter sp.]
MVHPLNPMTFPLHGTRLIEASAGTGKTYTIAALYLRLVLGHGTDENRFPRALTPPEILVVTFTNAATEELRERIRSRLTQAAAFFRGVGQGDPFLEALRGDYGPESRPAMALRLERAAQWMDEAAVHTIHGWCQRMLRQHAFDSLCLFDLELAPGDDDLLESAACDYWRSHFYPLDGRTLSEFMSVAGISTPQDLLARVRPLVNDEGGGQAGEGQRHLGADPFGMMEQRCAAIDRARQAWAEDFERAAAQVEAARAKKELNNNKYRKPSLEKWTRAMELWVNDNGPLPEAQALEKFSSAGLAAGAAKGKVPPAHPAYDALDLLIETLGGLDIRTALVCHAAAGIRRRVDEQKERLSRMGFNDLLTRLDQALSLGGSQGLARVIREQFPVAMIDEFQDTDPVQYHTFSTVYPNQPETGLFMIGDPKQAIYAFRGADIHTYLTARTDTRGRRFTLDTNYRSATGMVGAVNRLFRRATGFEDGAFLFKDQIPFEQVAVQGRSEVFVARDTVQTPMTLWLMDQDGPVAKTGPEGYVTRMARAAAIEISGLIRQGAQQPCRTGFRQADGTVAPLRPSDIAVLVRDGREAAAVRTALAACTVRSVYLSDSESVFATSEALSLLHLLRACARPGDDRLLRAALAVPLLNLPLERLDLLNRDETVWEEELDRFKTLSHIWHTRGVLPMVRALLAGFNVGIHSRGGSSGERQMTNVLHLAELLQAAAATLDGEQGLLRWLADRIETPTAGADEQIIRLESDEELVQVVTIHKSKGLEYPLVFLPFICSFRKTTARNTAVARFHDDGGRLQKMVNPDGDALARADRERLAEDLRMLYVALTRACHACWLGMGVMGKTTKKGETTDLHQSAVGHLLAGGQMIKTDDLAGLLADARGECRDIEVSPLPDVPDDIAGGGGPEPVPGPARKFTGRIPRNWRITSYSGILAGAAMESHGPAPVAGDAPSPDTPSQDQLMETGGEAGTAVAVAAGARSIHTFPRGPEPGTFLHDILEWAAASGFDRVSRDRPMVLDEITRRCTRRGWEDWSGVLTDWFMALLDFDMGEGFPAGEGGGAGIRLADFTRALCRAEMEFMFPAHGVEIHRLDRLVTGTVLPGIPRPALRRDRVNGMLKGFIDLVFCSQGRYFVLDYKSNHLGDTGAAYDGPAMAHAMAGHRYDLQYLLYILALHRLLTARLPDYDYDRDVGGAVYLFLRGVGRGGQGIYAHKPPKDAIIELDRMFRKGVRP